MGKLLNKIAVVTGGAKGIGSEVSRLFAKEGATVIITDLNPKNGKKIINEINVKNKIFFFKMDVSIEKDWKRFIIYLKKNKLQDVSILVNNAGIYLGKDILKVNQKEFNQLTSINLMGTFFGIKYLTALLKDTGEKTKKLSSIINLSSIAGLVGSRLDPLYSMTKGGITTFTKSMAIYYGNRKIPIKINQVHPGIIDTSMGDQVKHSRIIQNPKLTLEESHIEGIKQTPIGRIGKPNEIANGILFLASEESNFMTGSSLIIDGGLTAQ